MTTKIISFDDGDPMSFEPNTPKEIAQHKVGMTLLDCRLAAVDLVKLRNDPISGPFVAEREKELWEIKNAIELVLSSVKIENDKAA